MIYIYIGALLFGGPHLLSILFPALRDNFEKSLGEKLWKGLYAIVALAGLVFLAIGYLQSRAGPATLDILYDAPYELRHLTMLLVLLGFIFIGASHGKGYLKKWLRNPMSIGVSLWAIGHLLVNGQRADVWLFGTFLVVGLADIVLSEMRGKRPTFMARIRPDAIAVALGCWVWFLSACYLHPHGLNVPVIGSSICRYYIIPYVF